MQTIPAPRLFLGAIILGLLAALPGRGQNAKVDSPAEPAAKNAQALSELPNLDLSEQLALAGRDMDWLQLESTVLVQLQSQLTYSSGLFRRKTNAKDQSTDSLQDELKGLLDEAKALEPSKKDPGPKPVDAPPADDSVKKLTERASAFARSLHQVIQKYVNAGDTYRQGLSTLSQQVSSVQTARTNLAAFPVAFAAVPVQSQAVGPYALATAIGADVDESEFVGTSLPLSSPRIPTLKYFPHLESFLRSLLLTPREPDEKEYAKARDEIVRFYDTLHDRVYDADLQSQEGEIKKQLDEKEKELKEELAAKKKRQDDLSEQLASRDAFWNQFSINIRLTYAVYGMVIAIVLAIGLLCWLMFRPGDLAFSIVQDRVLVEILSMGFLLLTVIILGTGNLLKAEGLSALLGTIAGYIFGRKAAELAAGAVRSRRSPQAVWEAAEARASESRKQADAKKAEADAAETKATAAETAAASLAAGPAKDAADKQAKTLRQQAEEKNREADAAAKKADEDRRRADAKKTGVHPRSSPLVREA